MKFNTINPATGKVIREFETMSEKEVKAIAKDVNSQFNSCRSNNQS